MTSDPTEVVNLTELPLFTRTAVATRTSVVAPSPAGPVIGRRSPRRSRDRGAARAAVLDSSIETDWSLVRRMRSAAATQLAEALGRRVAVDKTQERELGEQIVADLVRGHIEATNAAGHGVDRALAHQLRVLVLDALFGLGRLQPLVDNPDLEDIEVYGCDRTVLCWADGTHTFGPPMADTDEELVEEIAFLAARAEASQRTFSPASPLLNLRLDGGARLAAHAWVSRRPVVVIRLHRLVRVTLADLVQRGMFSPELHQFLARAVDRRMTIVVGGAMGSGKTTLLRALCGEFDPWESVGTIETEFELHLDQMLDRHHRVHAVEMRPGSGERLADGSIAGQVDLNELTRHGWRWNLDRLILGEVRGPEVMEMFNVMSGGTGGMATVHAKSAHGAIQRLITLSLGVGPQVSSVYAQSLVGEHVDLVVHIDSQRTETGQRHRYVSEILAVEYTGDGIATTTVFAAGADRVARLKHLPHHLAAELGL